MKKIGLIGAMQVEIENIKNAMTDVTAHEIAASTFFEGKLGNTDVVLSCSGVGKVNAAVNAQILVSVFGCDCLINTGIAGNLSENLKLGDFVIADTVIYHDFDLDIFASAAPFTKTLTPDATLIDSLSATLKEMNIPFMVGTVATGDVFVQDNETKQRIIDLTQGLCTEMEGAAIGHVAARNGVPFGIIRCISDNSDDESVYENFFEEAANLCSSITIKTLENLSK